MDGLIFIIFLYTSNWKLFTW